ncbi:hypothetical protein [Streptomyces sp. NPDC056937]
MLNDAITFRRDRPQLGGGATRRRGGMEAKGWLKTTDSTVQ